MFKIKERLLSEISFSIAIVLLLISVPLHSEYMVLNDGTSIEGKIIESKDDVLTVRDNDNRIRKIRQKDISLILKSKKLKIGQGKEKKEITERKKQSDGRFLCQVKPGILVPLGKFGEMSETGYGLSVGLSRKEFLFNSFDAGMNAGFFYSAGKDLIDSRSQIYNRFILIPLFLSASYRWELSDKFLIIPELSAGAAYFDVEYEDHSTGPLSESEKNEKLFEPAVKAGLSCGWRFTDNLLISTGCDYGVIYEQSGIINFITLNAGITYTF